MIVCPEDTVTGPTILAFSVAAIESPPVNVCTFLYAPLILVNLAAVTVASVGAPTSKVSPKIMPEKVALLAGAAVNAIVPLDEPAVKAAQAGILFLLGVVGFVLSGFAIFMYNLSRKEQKV